MVSAFTQVASIEVKPLVTADTAMSRSVPPETSTVFTTVPGGRRTSSLRFQATFWNGYLGRSAVGDSVLRNDIGPVKSVFLAIKPNPALRNGIFGK